MQGQNYYKTAFNKGGDSLKSSLNQIIKNHTEFPYTSSSTDVWDILKETDYCIPELNLHFFLNK